jgi:hypothetical protein
MNSKDIREQPNGLVTLAIVSLTVGAAAGLLGTLFRLLLERADELRDVFVTWSRSEHAIGLVIVLLATWRQLRSRLGLSGVSRQRQAAAAFLRSKPC